MWINREISEKLLTLSKQYPALVLTGSRQTGKTSLLKHLFNNYNYVSLDLPSLAAQAEESPDAFLENYPTPLIIDEVQYAPKLFRHLKIMIDKDRHKMGQFILTGSQKFTLMKEISDSLAGRCAVLELETLNVKEISQTDLLFKEQKDILKVMVRGGFPDLWRDPSLDATSFYSSYLSTYLERDVRQLINVVSLRDFERFIRACAARNGQMLDKSSIGADVGISSKAANDWLSVLQASNQISLLEPWFGNFSKRLVKSPKLFFNDTGLACFLLNQDENSLANGPFIGSMWETLVYAELRKCLQSSPKPITLWYYRDAEKRKVDFLVQSAGENLAIECKWHEIPTLQDAKAIIELQSYLRNKPNPQLMGLKGLVVCRTPFDHPLSKDIIGTSLPELLKRIT